MCAAVYSLFLPSAPLFLVCSALLSCCFFASPCPLAPCASFFLSLLSLPPLPWGCCFAVLLLLGFGSAQLRAIGGGFAADMPCARGAGPPPLCGGGLGGAAFYAQPHCAALRAIAGGLPARISRRNSQSAARLRRNIILNITTAIVKYT